MYYSSCVGLYRWIGFKIWSCRRTGNCALCILSYRVARWDHYLTSHYSPLLMYADMFEVLIKRAGLCLP
jgi:hypothetical protein